MSGTSARLRSYYEIHGVGVVVSAEDPAVVEAMELRLREFSCAPGLLTPVCFEFLGGDVGELRAPVAEGRPVYDTPDGSLHYYPDSDVLWGEFAGVRLRCEPGHGVALLHCPQFRGRELYLATHPLVTVSLMEVLERRGLFSLHAACLAGPDGRGVLLAGASGAGKSTLALALALAGVGFLSDDVVFLARDDDSSPVRALGFADTVGVSEHAAARFGELRGLCGPAAEGFPKRSVRIEDLLGVPPVRSCEPRALVFPEVAVDKPSDIVPLDPGQALLRLVPDILVTDAAATQAHLRTIAALLHQVRCYVLRSGSDLSRAAGLIRKLI